MLWKGVETLQKMVKIVKISQDGNRYRICPKCKGKKMWGRTSNGEAILCHKCLGYGYVKMYSKKKSDKKKNKKKELEVPSYVKGESNGSRNRTRKKSY